MKLTCHYSVEHAHTCSQRQDRNTIEAWLVRTSSQSVGAGVLVVAWEITESKGKQDVASNPDSKMVGSLTSDPCCSKQLLLLSEAKNIEG